MRISDWSSDVCSSDLLRIRPLTCGRTSEASKALVLPGSSLLSVTVCSRTVTTPTSGGPATPCCPPPPHAVLSSAMNGEHFFIELARGQSYHESEGSLTISGSLLHRRIECNLGRYGGKKKY